MSLSKEITFQGYKISAFSQPYLDDYWAGGYEITQDGWHVRTSEFLSYGASEGAAQASALLMGIRYVDECLLPMGALRAEALRFKR